MRIEQISIEKLANLNDSELWKTRFRFTQVWDKYFAKSTEVVVGALNRPDILGKYAILTEVLKKRGRTIPTTNIDRALFKSALQKKNEIDHPLNLIVKEGDEHIVYGIVYEPDETDTQGDTASADEIRKAAHGFVEHSQAIKMNHNGDQINASLLESYLAPQELQIAGRTIKKGTWIMSVRINDLYVWEKIKKGELSGFSMAGLGQGISM